MGYKLKSGSTGSIAPGGQYDASTPNSVSLSQDAAASAASAAASAALAAASAGLVNLTSPGPIGSVTPGSGAFTTISASGLITASAGVAGNLTGNVSGTAANVTGTVAITNGGTGSATAAGARTNLGAATSGPLAGSGITGAAASGANADITSMTALSSINGGQLAGMRNRIINGGMQVAQRGTSGTVNGYVLDRWWLSYGGTQPTWGQSSSGVNVPWQGVTYVTINGIAGNTSSNFVQRIEAINCRDMAGQTVTVSYWCYQNTGSAMTVTTGLNYPTANDNYTSKTPISAPAGTPVQNIVWTKVTASFIVPTAATTGLELVCFNNAPAATAGITYGLTAVQLELGSVATPFEQRPYGLELMLCQRYLPAVELTASNFRYTGQCFTTSTAQCYVPFPVQARVAPTGFTASSTVTFSNAGGAGTGTAIMTNPTTTGAILAPTGASGLVSGDATGLIGGAASTKIFFDGCEL